MTPGVALPTGDDYTPWHVGLSASWTRPTSDTHWAEQMFDQGTIPFVHLMIDDTIHSIAAGNWDAEIEDWLMALLRYQSTGRKMVAVLFPEMNGNWTPYGQEQPVDHQAFIDAYRRIVDKGRTMGLDSVLWSFAPNDRGWAGDLLGSWYPGDDYVDVVGGSVYNWGGIFHDGWDTPADLIDPFVAEIRSFTNRRIVITQTGSGLNDPRTPAWLDQLVAYPVDWIWFNISEFRYGPGMDDFNSRVSVLDPSPPLDWFDKEAPMTGSRWAQYVLGELQEAFPDVRAGVWNCRKISGSSTWSQHSWGNALDLHHVGWPYEVSDRNYAFLDPIHQWLKTYQAELSIRTLLWRVRDHHNHIHLDGWPKGYGQPPCDGGSLRMQYNNGTVVSGDPGPVNGTPELPDREMIVVGEAQVLEKGQSGVAVADLQKLLVTLGFDLGSWPPYAPGYPAGADGEYGAATVSAVEDFQSVHDLIMTGKADGVTLHFAQAKAGYGSGGDHTHPVTVDIPGVRVETNTGGVQ